MKKPSLLGFLGLIGIISLCFCTSDSAPPEEYDIIISGVTIVDGTGQAPFEGNVAIKGKKIAAVGHFRGDASTRIDGTGLTACPGFIDPHSHADSSIFQYPLAENLIMQGITTVISGNCGFSPIPSKDFTFDQWLSDLEEAGISINLGLHIGHNSVREFVMGNEWKRPATDSELQKMKAYVEEAMKSGAFGMSSGIDAPWPGYFATMDEQVELAKIAADHGGLYVPHTRHIRSHWVTDKTEDYSYVLAYGPLDEIWVGMYRGYLEAIEVSKKAGVSLHIAHYSLPFLVPQPHPDFLEEAVAKASVEIIDKAREEGIDITIDIIPSGSSIAGKSPIIREFLTTALGYPEWLSKLEMNEFIEKLKNEEFRLKIREIYDAGRIKLGMVHTKVDPYWMDSFTVLTCGNREYEGKTISEIAKMRSIDALDAIFDILVEDPEASWVQSTDKRSSWVAIPALLQCPVAMPCTDHSVLPARIEGDREFLVGPYAYAMFAEFIGTAIREKGALSLEEAVKRATSLPAGRFGIANRGILKEGAFADIVLFDFENIKNVGTFLVPDQAPEGIDYVFVNGTLVYKDKAHTGKKPGKVLRHECEKNT